MVGLQVSMACTPLRAEYSSMPSSTTTVTAPVRLEPKLLLSQECIGTPVLALGDYSKHVTHYCRWNNLGYLASFITFIGATVFWVATITGVPNELPDPSVAYIEWDFLYWLPQVHHCLRPARTNLGLCPLDAHHQHNQRLQG